MASSIQRAWNNDQSGWRPAHWVRAKLTPAQRDEIRQRLIDGADAQELALEYGVSARMIRGFVS
jgi:hypothetical protein